MLICSSFQWPVALFLLHTTNQIFAQQIQKVKESVARGEQTLLKCITQLAVQYMLLTQPEKKAEEESTEVHLQIKGMVMRVESLIYKYRKTRYWDVLVKKES